VIAIDADSITLRNRMRMMMVIGTIVVRIISLRLAKIYTFINIRTVCSINKNKIIRIKRSSQVATMSRIIRIGYPLVRVNGLAL
jgi:hypothetical protein